MTPRTARDTGPDRTAPPVLQIRGAALRRGERTLWSGLDLDVAPGELIAVLGPSGSGKTTLLRAILGLEPLSAGTITALGQPVRPGGHGRKGNRHIGYLPQARPLPRDTAMRGRDLVALGVNGHRFGLPITRRADRERIDALIDAVGARSFANEPVGVLSGSSGCASGRRSPTIRACCCATNRSRASTSPTSRPSYASSTSTAARAPACSW